MSIVINSFEPYTWIYVECPFKILKTMVKSAFLLLSFIVSKLIFLAFLHIEVLHGHKPKWKYSLYKYYSLVLSSLWTIFREPSNTKKWNTLSPRAFLHLHISVHPLYKSLKSSTIQENLLLKFKLNRDSSSGGVRKHLFSC